MANTSGLTTDNTPLNTTVATGTVPQPNSKAAIIRSIGGFYAEVTVKETHRDDMTITNHPVEKGAVITDHAFKNPAQLTIEAGWSARGYSSGGLPLGLNDLYTSLLGVQQAATLLAVQTGKRLYENMLIRSLATETDEKTANVLMLTVQLQEIILVETLETKMPAAAVRASQASTNGVTDTGAKSATTYSGTMP